MFGEYGFAAIMALAAGFGICIMCFGDMRGVRQVERDASPDYTSVEARIT